MEMDFLTTIEAYIESEAKKAEDEIVKLANEFGPTILQYGEEFLASLAQIALGEVLQEAPLVMSGAEKFGVAVTSVVEQVEAQGKQIAIQDAHLVVQAAYNKAAQIAGSSKTGA